SFISFSIDVLPSWEPAFAMTVHKSQGSEFDDVLVVLPDNDNHRLLTREIIYTGITRAKKRLILYGSESAFKTALQRKIERQSGLMW
ncbi:MAG: ATP-binding domain-containing protein, partial [Desulfobacterales bacterium]|nr:ATP-binding domain-containing protein [Desulfobacterales bacterium]